SVFAPVEDARTMRLAAKQAKTVNASIQQDTYATAENDFNLQKTGLLGITSEVEKLSNNSDVTQEIPGSLLYEILGFLNPDSIDIMNLVDIFRNFRSINSISS
ncbi:2952_t:CDS:1, partial [Acaulospora colombiana]